MRMLRRFTPAQALLAIALCLLIGGLIVLNLTVPLTSIERQGVVGVVVTVGVLALFLL